MARSHDNFKPMKSRKNGLKDRKLIDQNNKILKKYGTKKSIGG